MARLKAKTSTRVEVGGFIRLPHCVVRSVGYSMLSAWAVKLMIDLTNQFDGKNNGDLSMAYSVLKDKGWHSPATLDKAKKELINAGFIEVSRQGNRKRCALYAVTFYAVDSCNGKIEIKPSEKPKGLWRKNEPVPDINQSRINKLAKDDKLLMKALMDRAKRESENAKQIHIATK